MKMMIACFTVSALLLSAIVFSGCATVPSGQQVHRAVAFDLNQETVQSVRPVRVTSGYGLDITLSGEGLAKMREARAKGVRYVGLIVDGQFLGQEMHLGSSIPREFRWTRQIGVDELTKEEAETLTQKILGQ